MSEILSIHQLVKNYGGLRVSDEIDLSLKAGEIHALIGPNGAGKTTLINQLCGEIIPDGGQIRFLGQDITRLPIDKRAQAGLARSYQITSVFSEFSVLENVALALIAHEAGQFSIWQAMLKDKRLVEAAHHMLNEVGLGKRAGVVVNDLAHGERRQLELAMALVGQPKLLLLDEPMAGMSQKETANMVNLLQTLKGRYTLLLVEHDMDAVFTLADRISVIVYGKVIASGEASHIKDDKAVRAAYLGDESLSL